MEEGELKPKNTKTICDLTLNFVEADQSDPLFDFYLLRIDWANCG